MMLRIARSRARRGIVLIAVAVSLLLMTAGLGLGIDLNRLLIAQRGLRAAAEASALAAALEIDGTEAGQQRGRDRALALWREQTARFGEPAMNLEFAEDDVARVSGTALTDLTLLRTVVQQRSVSISVSVTARAVTANGKRSAEVLP